MMQLESTIKFFSPKTSTLSDSSRCTSPDSLTNTDVMAAIGMMQQKAGLGVNLFLGKHEISKQAEQTAINELTQFALSRIGKCRPLAKLDKVTQAKICKIIAQFAYQDYCRSAASKVKCPRCNGKGLISKTIKKVIYGKEIKEAVKHICKHCNGKGLVSASCQCNGRGVVLDIAKSKERGEPVYKDCNKCNGRGYTRLPLSSLKRIIDQYCDIPRNTFYNSIKLFYEVITTECYKREEFASKKLKKVMK